MTFLLMLTIFDVESKKESSTINGFIIGLVVAALIPFSGTISGGSFNPARSFAPAVISGNITALWTYLTTPILGTTSALLVWKVFK